MFAARRGALPDGGPGGEGGGEVLFIDDVRIHEIADHSGGEKHVLAAVVVEIGNARGPSPAAGRQAGQVGGLLKVVGAGVEKDGVPRVLRHDFGGAFHLPEPATDLFHAGHVALARAIAHVGNDDVDPTVVVQVAGIGAHREVGDMGKALAHDVNERAVTLVEVKPVGRFEIVGDIKVGPAIMVGVDPDRGVTLRQAPDSGLFRDVGERAIAVVVEQIIAASERTLREIEDIGHEIAVQKTVAVVIGKGGHDRCILHVEAVFVGAFGEGAVAVVDEEQIRGVVPAEVDIRPAVLVDIHHGRANLWGNGVGAIDAATAAIFVNLYGAVCR